MYDVCCMMYDVGCLMAELYLLNTDGSDGTDYFFEHESHELHEYIFS